MIVEGIDKLKEQEANVADQTPQTHRVHRKGIINTFERDYKLLDNAHHLKKGDNLSLARRRSMSRTRSASRTRETIGSTSVARNKAPSVSQPTMGDFVKRHRSISRSRAETRDESGQTQRRGRSSSRVRSAIKGVRNVLRGRSKSKNRLPPSGNAAPRGRSMSRRRDAKEKSNPTLPPSSNAPKLPPKLPSKPKRVNTIDTLKTHDVMQLDESNTVMHAACLLHHNEEDILERLEEDPSLAFEVNRVKELPLHYAAMDKQGVSSNVFKKLLEINPDGVKNANVQESLPIHLACMVGAPSLGVIKTFLKMYPKSVMMKSEFPLLFEKDMLAHTQDGGDSYDSDDDSDILAYKQQQPVPQSGIARFFACGAPTQAELEFISESQARKHDLEKNYSEDSFDGPDIETGFTPLHLAVMNNAHPLVVEAIIKTDPECLNVKTNKGRTPMDCANYLVNQHILYGDDNDDGPIKNTFAAVELMEEALNNMEKE